MKRHATIISALMLCLAAPACDSSKASPNRGATKETKHTLEFPSIASLTQAGGKGSFRFGVSTASAQIEEGNTASDWWAFTTPQAGGGLGKGAAPLGDAADGYSLALEDIALLKALHVDSYRFSIEWARVEPKRNQIDEEALNHYSKLIDALLAAHIRPMITVLHFSNPVWIDDPRDPTCANGPSDANLCGLDNPVGAPQIISEAGEFATLLARRFGDRVDEWGTVNEPVNYLLSAYGVGSFPPGKALILSEDTFKTGFATALATYTKMHAAIYHAIKTEDTEDADKDGSKADVGLPLSVGTWVPARDNALSTNPDDIKARDRMEYIYNHLFVDALRSGSLDTNFDGTPDTDIPGLEGTIDWLGVQYYFRTGVSSQNAVVASLGIAPCLSTFDFGACVPPANEDTTKCVPAMKYEFYEQGLYEVLKDFSTRWKGLPLLVTESGIATETGRRRAEHVVRSLEQIQRARNDGVDVRGYYHWSLYDNFEWALGYVPRFGLYSVDFTTYERTPTEGATIYSAVAKARTITTQQHKEFGGTGPMTPESGATSAARCNL